MSSILDNILNSVSQDLGIVDERLVHGLVNHLSDILRRVLIFTLYMFTFVLFLVGAGVFVAPAHWQLGQAFAVSFAVPGHGEGIEALLLELSHQLINLLPVFTAKLLHGDFDLVAGIHLRPVPG